jgi:hypothetical protein
MYLNQIIEFCSNFNIPFDKVEIYEIQLPSGTFTETKSNPYKITITPDIQTLGYPRP